MQRPRNIKSVTTTIAFFFTSVAYANVAHDQLSSMSEKQRQSVLATFLVKSGEKCSAVAKTFYQGSDKRGNAFWNAACTGGASFVIQVNNDATGSTRILSCKLLEAVNGGTCFTKFKS
jgi:flagellar basal body rod protein FlgG